MSAYPPERHYLRDLRLQFEPRDAGVRVTLPVASGLCDETGSLRSGVLLTAIDIAGGSVAGPLASPEWVATSDISLHVLGPQDGPELTIDCELIRRGRSLIVLATEVADAQSCEPRATAGAAFSILPARGAPQGGGEAKRPRPPFPRSSGELVEPVVDKLGIEPIAGRPGHFRMPLSDYVRNTYSALQGGVPGVLGELAACARGSEALGRPVAVRDLRVRYLSQGRTGPFEARPATLRESAAEVLCRVAIVDCGAEDRLVALATCSVG